LSDLLLTALTLIVLIVAAAIFSNRQRARQEISFSLETNCLLTRWPLLFVSGPRSFFYFANYWNNYPSYLAEHGYEVFKLNLPWNKTPWRQKRFQEFIHQQHKLGSRFHLIVDSATLAELETVLHSLPAEIIMSLTEITDQGRRSSSRSLKPFTFPQFTVEALPSLTSEGLPSPARNLLLKTTFALHKLSLPSSMLLSLSTLGACKESAIPNGKLLLEQAKFLAERDLQQDSPCQSQALMLQ